MQTAAHLVERGHKKYAFLVYKLHGGNRLSVTLGTEHNKQREQGQPNMELSDESEGIKTKRRKLEDENACFTAKMLTREELVKGTRHHPRQIQATTARGGLQDEQIHKRKTGKSEGQARLCMKVASSLDSDTQNLKHDPDKCSQSTTST
jgi:hypothetical protein